MADSCRELSRGYLEDGLETRRRRLGDDRWIWSYQPFTDGPTFLSATGGKMFSAAFKKAAVGSAVVGVALALAPAGGAQADQAPPSPSVKAADNVTIIRFVIRGKSRCITVPGWSNRRGTPLNLWDCVRSKPGNQKWGIRGPKVGNYVAYQIYNAHNKMCLNVAGGSKANGAKIVQWPCSWRDQNSSWVWKKRASGQLLFNARSGKCLSVANGSTRNGAALIQWTCNDNSPNQKIYF
jgi:hypothetical protein